MADNIAFNKYASASSYVFPYTPAKAVDGVLNPLARWLGSSPLPPSSAPAPVWLSVDLNAYYWVNRWVVKQMGALGWSPNYNLTDYKLQGSLDNANWFDMDSVVGNSANQTDRAIAPTKVRWARIYVTKGLRCNTNFAAVADLELYAADPTDSKLSSLVLSNSIALDPQFNPTTNTYSANAKYDDVSITVTPTAVDSRATIKVAGLPTASGQPSAPVSLNAGVNNPVPVEVTPFIGEANTYTVNVVRASSPYLTGIAVKSGRVTIPLTPSFSRTTENYTGTINGATSISVTSDAEDTNATIRVKGQVTSSGVPVTVPVSPGLNNIDIVVEAKTGVDSKTYVCAITVT
jgi:hypothetical protein